MLSKKRKVVRHQVQAAVLLRHPVHLVLVVQALLPVPVEVQVLMFQVHPVVPLVVPPAAQVHMFPVAPAVHPQAVPHQIPMFSL